MPRPRVSVPPEAIRIEDEVWQDAFARIEEPPRRRLHAIEGGRSTPAAPAIARPTMAPPGRTAPPPRTVAAAATVARSTPATVARPAPAPARRTVTIRGYGAELNLPWPDTSRRRPQPRPYERAGFRPDRLAMWAVFLGVLLLV